MSRAVFDYVWIDGKSNLRSKKRVLNTPFSEIKGIGDIPMWNYDGSSTYQAEGTDSEIILKPCAMFKKNIMEYCHTEIFVLCETYFPNGEPCPTNHRYKAKQIFDRALDEEPWFGLEQEYFMCELDNGDPIGFKWRDSRTKVVQGKYYCSVGTLNAFGRELAEEHLRMCIDYGIKISGINAEVAPGQWEFQIGPCTGIEQGDHMWMARYFLYKLSENYDCVINISPKPLSGEWNGSGCHTNFSTKNMREGTAEKTGLEYINEAIDKLSEKHKEHMEVYGENNHLRMTGECETSSYDVFSDGIANRGASVRRGHDTIKNKKGYFEDRRPSSNCDPYLVTSKIFETCVL